MACFRPVIALLAVSALASLSSAQADPARELTWEDLLPPALMEVEREAMALQQRLRTLEPDERKAFNRVSRELIARDKLELGYETEATLSEEERALLAEKPSDAYPEAFAFWSKVRETQSRLEALNSKVDSGLDQTQVRLPGYMLPLEFNGQEVSEFLLVPVVGACIHVPSPPANQLVYVKTSESVSSDGLYAPVWVEGVILARGGVHELTARDGQAPVDVGYTIEGARVEPYK